MQQSSAYFIANKMSYVLQTVVIFLGLFVIVCDNQSISVGNNIYDSLQPLDCGQVSRFQRQLSVLVYVQIGLCPALVWGGGKTLQNKTFRYCTVYIDLIKCVARILFSVAMWLSFVVHDLTRSYFDIAIRVSNRIFTRSNASIYGSSITL